MVGGCQGARTRWHICCLRRFAVGEGQLVNFVQHSYKSPFIFVHAAPEKGKKMKVQNSRKSGFTLVEIMIVVAIIGLLAAIAIPNFVKARTASQANACIANMKQVEGAKATWALEAKKNNTDTPLAEARCVAQRGARGVGPREREVILGSQPGKEVARRPAEVAAPPRAGDRRGSPPCGT